MVLTVIMPNLHENITTITQVNFLIIAICDTILIILITNFIN